MWIDQTAKPIPSATYDLYSNLQWFGYDSNNSAAFWTVLTSSLFMVVLQTWAWLPFEADYSEKAEIDAHHHHEEALAEYLEALSQHDESGYGHDEATYGLDY